METTKIITEEIGYYSPYATLDEALAQFNTRGRQMVCDYEPSEVTIRQYINGAPYLFTAHQVHVRMRLTPRGHWQSEILTFGMDRYGTRER